MSDDRLLVAARKLLDNCKHVDGRWVVQYDDLTELCGEIWQLEWASVDERLPEFVAPNESLVVHCVREKFQYLAFYRDGRWYDQNYSPTQTPEYWRKLPTPPEDK